MLLLLLSRRKQTSDASSIGNKPVAVGVQFLVEFVIEHGASGSQDGRHVVVAAEFQRVQRHFRRNLQADEKDFAAGQMRRRRSEDLLHAETRVGAGGDDRGFDAASLVVDVDVSDAGGRRTREDD